MTQLQKKIRERVIRQYPSKTKFAKSFNRNSVIAKLFLVFRGILFGSSGEIRSKKSVPQDIRKMLISAEVGELSKRFASNGYHRTRLTSGLVQRFINSVQVDPNMKYPQLHKIQLEFETFLEVEVLKNVTYYAIIQSPIMQVVQYRGRDMITRMFNALKDDRGIHLLPDDFRSICEGASSQVRTRAICDFIAGMTDRYAFEFYERLFGAERLTVYKPL